MPTISAAFPVSVAAMMTTMAVTRTTTSGVQTEDAAAAAVWSAMKSVAPVTSLPLAFDAGVTSAITSRSREPAAK